MIVLSTADMCLQSARLKGEFMCVFTQQALVDVLIAGSADVSGRAGAKMAPADRVSVAVGALLTRIADAGVVQLAQQTWSRQTSVTLEPDATSL